MSRWNRTKRSRIERLEAWMNPPPTLLDRWLKTLADDDVDHLAEAAKAMKAGLPDPTDPSTIARLEDNYRAFYRMNEGR